MESSRITIDQENESNSGIRDDLRIILNNELADTPEETNIIYGNPSLDEVMDWHFRRDPVAETPDLAVLMSDYTDEEVFLHGAAVKQFTEILCEEKGAAVIMASLWLGEDIHAYPPQVFWDESTAAKASKAQGTKIDKWHSPQEIAAYSLMEILRNKQELKVVELESMLIAGEMLMSAASNPMRSHVALTKDKESNQPFYLSAESATEDRRLGYYIFGAIQDKGFAKESSPDERKVAVKATMQNNAFAVADIKNMSTTDEEASDSVKKVLSEYISILEREFTGGNRLQITLGKAEAKGLLHEALWLLDSIIISEATGFVYHTVPARSAHDRPRINRPLKNRAFDVMLLNDSKAMRFQLKSNRSRPGQIYHPDIEVLEENNFMDFNERRLIRKLNSYKKLMESGYYSNEAAEQAQKYLMPTAVEAARQFYTRQTEQQVGRSAILSNRYGLSKAK